MVDGIKGGLGGAGAAARLQQAGASAPPGEMTIPSIWVGQHGAVAVDHADKPLIPGVTDQLEKLVVRSLNPHGGKGTAEYAIDDAGVLHPSARNPITEGPMRLEVVAKDGTRYAAEFDVSPKAMKKSTQGYFELKNLKLAPLVEEKPAAPLPDKVEPTPFLLSQWGQIAMPESAGRTPFLPKNDGAFVALHVEQGGAAKTYAIDDQGRLDSGRGPSLGDRPAKLVLEHASGARFEAHVDVSSKKTKGVGSAGYHLMKGVVFQPAAARAHDDALGDAAIAFAKAGGAKNQAPTLEQSPLGVRFFSR